VKATEQLKKEHLAVKVMLRVLDRICKRLEAGEDVEAGHLDEVVEFFKVFVDRCHHAKEESMLFVAMKESTDPNDGDRIGALVKDHVSGRQYIKSLGDATADYRKSDPSAPARIINNARHYITLLIQHIDIEDNVLYPIADERLSEKKQQELFRDFDRLEAEEIGVGRHEEFHKMIDRLKGAYLS